MQFLLMIKTDAKSAPPTPELMAAIGKLVEDMTKAGVLVQTGGMQGSAGCTTMKLAAGKVSATDGPYAESKELVGGYAIIDVKSRAEAIRLASRFLEVHARVLGPGFEMETEVREMYPQGAFKGASNGRAAAAAR